MSDTMTPGQRLRLFGESAFGSVKMFAQALEMKQPNLQKYLAGQRLPGSPVLRRIAELGCNIHWLISGDGDRYADNAAGTALRERLVKAFEPEPLPGYPILTIERHPLFTDIERMKRAIGEVKPGEREKLLEELNKLLEIRAELLHQENLLQKGQIAAFEKILGALGPR